MYMTQAVSDQQEVVANTQYFTMLTKYEAALCIADDGADTHVGGTGWLPITPTEGPGVKYANLVGFDKDSAKKANLPIVAAITKVEDQYGKEIILRAKHMVLNQGSPHTLLSEYQMRETGLVVDTVAKHHLKDNEGSYGTQSITLQDGKVIILNIRAALMTFKSVQPTLEEYNKLPVYDIGLENWSPRGHYDDDSIFGQNSKPKQGRRRIMISQMKGEMKNEPRSKIIRKLDDKNHIKPILDANPNLNTESLGFSDDDSLSSDDSTTSGEMEEQNSGEEQMQPNHDADSNEDIFHDAMEQMEDSNDKSGDEELYFFDATDILEPTKPGKVMHLTIDYQTIGKGEKGRKVSFVETEQVDTLLRDIDYYELTGNNNTFDALVYAVTTVEKL